MHEWCLKLLIERLDYVDDKEEVREGTRLTVMVMTVMVVKHCRF